MTAIEPLWDTTREPSLLRNTASWRFYGRFTLSGKQKWVNRETDVWTVPLMLGDRILVAPVLAKGIDRRMAALPPGRWNGLPGQDFEGPRTAKVPAEVATLNFFSML